MKAIGRHEYNLSERVTQYLIKRIQQNDLKPGDRVPSEVQVSGDLGISRGVVRQAYHSLRKSGITRAMAQYPTPCHASQLEGR